MNQIDNLENNKSILSDVVEAIIGAIYIDAGLNNCKIFIRNKNKDVILISPLKKINYRINSKSKVKNFYNERKDLFDEKNSSIFNENFEEIMTFPFKKKNLYFFLFYCF